MITIRCVPFSEDVHPESDCYKVGGFSASRMAAVTTSRNTIPTPQHKREFKQRHFDRRTSTASGFFALFGRDFEQILAQIVS